MLSRFDLKHGESPKTFQCEYDGLFARLKSLGLVEATGKIGERVDDTPMDTDDAGAPRFYVLMSFRDRDQLDRAYTYFDGGFADIADQEAHHRVNQAVKNAVFTCWQDGE